MEMDYNQLESNDDRLHDNLFSNPWKSIALEFGGMAVGSAIQRYGRSQEINAIAAEKLAASTARGSGLGNLPGTTRSNKLTLAHRHRASARGSMAFGKSIKRFGHVFGMIGLAQVAFEISSSVLGTAGSFATSKSDVEAMRYRQMYDQDTYYDTRAAYTQRQRALQVIHNTRLSLKPALGNESNYLHQ